ncbi:MAG: hypothetical protein ACFFD4_32485 [Candidatus Odinarchaeota archaeon]
MTVFGRDDIRAQDAIVGDTLLEPGVNMVNVILLLVLGLSLICKNTGCTEFTFMKGLSNLTLRVKISIEELPSRFFPEIISTVNSISLLNSPEKSTGSYTRYYYKQDKDMGMGIVP